MGCLQLIVLCTMCVGHSSRQAFLIYTAHFSLIGYHRHSKSNPSFYLNPLWLSEKATCNIG